MYIYMKYIHFYISSFLLRVRPYSWVSGGASTSSRIMNGGGWNLRTQDFGEKSVMSAC